MTGRHASIILLPTLKCNVECDYCFEEKTGERLTLDEFQTILDRVVAHMVRCQVQDLTIYWQGGEIMTLPPSWFVEAYARIQETAARAGVGIHNSLQSNMIGYSERWNDIIEKMFDNDVGTSMDFPNIHRKLGGSVKKYGEVWSRNMRQAREAGIHLGVIALPNPQTLELGAEAFYTYFVEESDVVDFQVNMPFPGGGGTRSEGWVSTRSTRSGAVFVRPNGYLDRAGLWPRRENRSNGRTPQLFLRRASHASLHLARQLRPSSCVHRCAR